MNSKVLPIDVAQYIINIFKEKDECITTMKLQKLVYYQAFSMVWEDEPIFEEDFHAWVCGPMIMSLHEALKDYYYCPETIPCADISNINDDQKKTIDTIFKLFGSQTSFDLVMMPTDERPWQEARGDLDPDEPSDNIITKESMLEFHIGKMAQFRGD